MTPDPRDEDLLSLLRRQAHKYGERTLMTFGDGETMSFADLHRRVTAFGSHLVERGIEPGESVALMMKNSLFYPVAWLGVLAAGAVAVPVNSRLGAVDAGFILEHSGSVAVVVDEATAEVARAAAPSTVRTFFGNPGPYTPGDDQRTVKGLHGGTLANIQYTSGTTGFPKGCLLTHRYWQRMGAATAEAFGLAERDTILTSQPFSYIDPQWNVIAALRAGAHLVLLDGFHPTTFMRDVARFEVTVFYCLGVMPTLLLKQPAAEHDRNALERVFCSAIPVDRHAEIEERWGAPWYEIFGMTESGVNIGVTAEDHDRTVGTGCLGRPLWHNEASVVDQNDRPVPIGEVGELVIRGLGFMDGYHRDPEATADFFRNGWGHTGDLCAMDEDGLIYYRGRRKEMIRRGGENIAPVEIESALATHADVVECAVASVPDAEMGEEIKAYVVVREDADVEPSHLSQYLRDRLAPFKIPRYWEFRDDLPHTPSEKIAKPKLEEGRDDWRTNTVDLKAG